MANTEQLFEINKRINQIKRNLQSRQERAQQWCVPYQKILHNPRLSQTYQGSFRNTHSGKFATKEEQMLMTFNNKTQRKEFFEKKAKESRKRINEFHNELKQLQELQELKTKIYGHKEHLADYKNHKQQQTNFDKTSKTQSKTGNKLFNNSMLLTAVFAKATQKNLIRTLRDRVNPFQGLKVQKMIELYQEGKYSGKENMVNHTLGMGIEFTPYSNIKKDSKKEDEPETRQLFGENGLNLLKILSTQTERISKIPNEDKSTKPKNLVKALDQKISDKKQIYLDPLDLSPSQQESCSPLRKKTKTNIFQHRMKKLLEETSRMEECEGSYVQILKKCRNKQKANYLKNSIGKVQANNTYKTVFERS